MKNKKKYLIVIIALAMLTIVFFYDAVTVKKVFITGDLDGTDIMDQYYPMRKFFADSLRRRSIPLWNPYMYNGFPALAEGQGALFYPLNLIMFLILPAPAAYNYIVLLNFIMSGVFLFIFARSVKISVWGSLAGAVTFMFSGFFIAHLKHMNMINTAVWIPLLFYSVEMFFRRYRMKYAVLAGVIFGLQLLAGHPQITFYTALGVVFYALYKLGTSIKRGTGGTVKPLKMLKSAVVVVAIAIGLSAVQMFPSSEFLPLSTRSIKTSYEQTVGGWSYEPADLVTMVSPYHYGDAATANYRRGNTIFWENCGYAGILPFLLGVMAILVLFKKSPHVRFFSVFILILFILIMPKTFPLFKLFWYVVPGFKLFRFPQRMLVLIGFSVAVLAGFGFDWVLGLFHRMESRKFLEYIAGITMICLIVFDLFRFGMGHNPLVDRKLWFSKPDTVEFLEKDGGLFRIFGLIHNYRGYSSWRAIYSLEKGWKGDLTPYINHRKLLPENSNMIYGIQSARGYSSLYLKRFYFLENALAGRMSFAEKTWDVKIPDSVSKVLGLFNVKYIPSVWMLKGEKIKQVMSTYLHPRMPRIKIFRNEDFIPRAFIVPRAIELQGDSLIIKTLLAREFDPLKTVILEETVLHGSNSCEGSTVRVVGYSAKEVEISADLTSDGFLVLTDTYYPGWKAWVDGRKERILQADYIFRALPLNKGSHKVRFVYKPVTFRVGAFVSAFTALVLITLMLVPFQLNKERE